LDGLNFAETSVKLINGFKVKISTSNLDDVLKAELNQKIDLYLQTFEVFVEKVLDHKGTDGGRGPFRQAAHHIEDLLLLHRVPDLGYDILQLRRREKDYLLRGDVKYVQWALREIETIRKKISASVIASTNKNGLIKLTETYQTDFLALVEQNRRIEAISKEMRTVLAQIIPLVDQNVIYANKMMAQVVERTRTASMTNSRLMLWIVLTASFMGIILAWIITMRITRPLHRIGSSLGQLSHGDPAQRVPFFGGRNEVDAMAGAVNTLADHQERTTAWHAASFRYDAAILNRDVMSMANPETIQAAEKELQKSRESRSLLLSIIRDEVNTLMDGILHSSIKATKVKSVANTKEYMANIQNNAQALLDIVEIITDFPKARESAPTIKIEPFNMHELIDTLSNFFREYARKKDINFKVILSQQLPDFLLGDAGQLRLILVNLLSNAVKYTEKGEVCIEVEVLEIMGKRVELHFLIRDSGMGMSTNTLSTIFEPHSGLEAIHAGKYQRTGQGLMMTRQVVKLLGGEINSASQLGHGSTFSVAIPLELVN
jgi:signal transduction histidine kinase